ncbi:MAG: hypothetical protein JOY58_00555 [Solirubrobacterales bacterium]|nr:hypothetical protein [Solirubrobacterales bacterium]
MAEHLHDDPSLAFGQAERRLFAACGVKVEGRRVRLADPPVLCALARPATARRSCSCTEAA